jgi:hypothetical protein
MLISFIFLLLSGVSEAKIPCDINNIHCKEVHDLAALHKADNRSFIDSNGPIRLLRSLISLNLNEEATELIQLFPVAEIAPQDREEYEYLLWKAFSAFIPKHANVCIQNPATGTCDEGRLLHRMVLRFTAKYPDSKRLDEIRQIADLYYQYELKRESGKLQEAVNQYEAAVYPKSAVSRLIVNGMRGNNRRTDGKVYANCVGSIPGTGTQPGKCDLQYKHAMISRVLLYAFSMEEWVKPEDSKPVRAAIARYLQELKNLMETDPKVKEDVYPAFRNLDLDQEIQKRTPASVPKTAAKEPPVPKFSFFVGQHLGNESWYTEKLCKFLKLTANIVSQNKITGPCRALTDPEMRELVAKKTPVALDPSADYNLYFWEDVTLQGHLYISRPKIKNDIDFQHLEWKIDPDLIKEVNFQALFKLLSNIYSYASNEKDIKKFLLVNGVAESKKVTYNEEDGTFLDKTSNKEVDFEYAYAVFVKEKIRQKNYMSAGLQITALLGGGIAWYYKNKDFNMVDWDYNGEFSMKNRVFSFDQWKFDDNGPGINRKHLNAGLGYYLASRMSGFTALESFLIGLTASSFWEYFVEYREVISINDQILTPVGGYVLGEVFYQIGSKLLSRHGGKLSKLLDNFFGGSGRVSNWVRGIFPRRGDEASIYGFDPGYFAEFNVGIKAEQVKDEKGTIHKDLAYFIESEIIDIPLFDQPGMAKKLIMDTAFTRLLIHSTATTNAIDDLRLLARTAFMAYYQKNLSLDTNGNLNGFSFFIAPGSGLDIDVRKEKIDGEFQYKHMYFNVNVLGGTMNLVGYLRGVKLRAVIEVYGDFAMVKSYALDGFKEKNDISGAGNLLNSEEGYYYGGGMTGAFGLSVDIKGLEFGYRFSQTDLQNITGRERDSDTITERYVINDRKRVQELFVKLRTKKNLVFKCGIERIERSGRIEDFQPAIGVEHRKSCSVMYSFL